MPIVLISYDAYVMWLADLQISKTADTPGDTTTCNNSADTPDVTGADTDGTLTGDVDATDVMEKTTSTDRMDTVTADTTDNIIDTSGIEKAHLGIFNDDRSCFKCHRQHRQHHFFCHI